MQIHQAKASLGKRARLNYATGGEPHAEGQVLGYSEVPMILIETDDGRQIWWRHDLTETV